MENEVGVSGRLILGIAPRICTIVFAMILIVVSSVTIGIIDNRGQEPQDLTNRSLSAAGWLIALSASLLIGEAIATFFAIIHFQSSLKRVMQILDVLFSIAVAICYGATGIACATYAAAWREEPALALTVTNVLSTVFSFIQVAMFGLIAVMVIYTIVKTMQDSIEN